MYKINPKPIVELSKQNESNHPVTTARYMVEFVMNEEEPDGTNEEHIERFKQHIQEQMNEHGFTESLRYDAVDFNVNSREVIDTAPANNPEN